MIVEIDIPDLIDASKAINNAGAAYQRLISMIDVGVELPPQFQKLYDYSESELKEHILLLRSIVMQLDVEILKLD